MHYNEMTLNTNIIILPSERFISVY